ncbi:MAG TPA: glycosyltransferase family 2 protein [Candidatus Acidoferrales bacterium]
MLTVFSSCLVLIVYVYAGYPLLLRLGVFGPRRDRKHGLETFPFVSFIVPAHNEEAGIAAKIANLLALDYPRERVEILIGSDGSSDRTDDLVRRYSAEGVGLVSFPRQHGKSAIQNSLVSFVSGEILVFTDADCLFAPESLKLLLDNFADPSVGLVTARPHFENSAETSVTHNEGIYLRYETWIRKQESTRGLLVLASGSLFAVRRSLWQPLDAAMGDDFLLPLRVSRAGFRNVLELDAVAVTRLSQDQPKSMFRMKVRIIAKDFLALLAHRDLLNPLRHRALAIALWSHKLLRWFVPYFLLVLFAANLFLLHSAFFRAFLAWQCALYALACCGTLFRATVKTSLISVPASFCIVNAAALVGTFSCLFGRTFAYWRPDRAHSPAAPNSLQSRRARP